MRFSKDVFFLIVKRKMATIPKMKRPEIELYIPPALRCKCNNNCEDKMAYAKDKYANEAENRQVFSIGYHDSSHRLSRTREERRVRFDSSSSSSNPRNISDASCKDDDSSDFDECCSVPLEAMSDEEICMGTNKNNSNGYWNKERRKPRKDNPDIETENYRANTKLPNKILTLHEDHSDVESHANQLLNSESNEVELDRGLFFNDGDSTISDIEAMIDTYTKKGRVYTSTPNSDIVQQKVLDAASYSPDEESGMESTLLDQSDIREIEITTNRNEHGCNFGIYRDPSSVQSQLEDFSEMFGNNYIPPPVSPPHPFLLPPIHRLPLPASSSKGLSVIRNPSPQLMGIQQRHPRPLLPQSLQLDSSLTPASSILPRISSHMCLVPRTVLSPRLQAVTIRAPNLPRMPSSIQPTLLSQERFNRPGSPQEPNALYLHPPSHTPQTQEPDKQDVPFYIPPPVPPPQHMNGRQQIRKVNQYENFQGYLPHTNSLVNRIKFDDKVSPQNLNTKR